MAVLRVEAVGWKGVTAAALLAALALIPMIYGAINLGVAVNVRNVEVSSDVTGSLSIPRRTVWMNEYKNGLTVSGLADLAIGDQVTIRFELLADKSLSGSVRNIIAIIDVNGDGTYDLTDDAYVTLSKPWEEFTYTVEDDGSGNPVKSKSWNVYVIIWAGARSASGTFGLTGSVAAYTPAA